MSRMTHQFLRFLGGCSVKRVNRPSTAYSPQFMLSYVRSGPKTDYPTVVIPGGPGLGAVLPYRGFRRLASDGGLDVIMIEHRGVGLSRVDITGRDLPHDAMWVSDVLDDIAAVLDREGVSRAFIAGSSYGSHVALAFGARYPDRVAGMLCDSTLVSVTDLALERDRIRTLFCAEGTQTSELISVLRDRHGIDERILLDTVRAAYELGGAQLLAALLKNRVHHRGSLTWRALSRYATRDETLTRLPGFFEFDIAGAIGFRELEYASPPDGGPLDPALTYAPLQREFPRFVGEPYDLLHEVKGFTWPLVLLVGAHDVRTPPAVAQRVADSALQATTVLIQNGHSALDTHPVAFINAVRLLVGGRIEVLNGLGARLDRLPRRGLSARFAQWLLRLSRSESFLLSTKTLKS